ncbi:MipA/OmpV family protein [Fangia hongkongensis]|uniref:MipA/OmpV family protein n=1 Tax=Fangia hongkongensis TaxID=270495 RepID=UPI0009FE135A|nr:MipA/OmpV family protein [Fangia hongkongensis]
MLDYRKLCVIVGASCMSLSYGQTINQAPKNEAENSPKELTVGEESTSEKKASFDVTRPWSIGVGSIFSPNPYKSSDDKVLAFPMVAYKGENLRVLGPYVGYKFLGNQVASLSVDAFLYPQVFDPDSSSDPQLQKLDERHYMVMGGLSGKLQTPYGRFQAGVNMDLTAGTTGIMMNFQYLKAFVFESGKHMFITTPGIGVQWTQDKILDYYYGVSASESARSGLNEYHPDSAFSPYLSLSLMYRYNKRWAVTGAFRLNQLPKTVTDSPMVGQTYVLTSALSFTYSF